MIDIETHKVIDLINSRELEDVKKWLETFINLKIVSRDGSVTYKNAITSAHPSAIQVSDRFHLLKNLTDYCKDYLKTKFSSNIIIDEITKDVTTVQETNNLNRYLTLEEKWKRALELLAEGNTKSSICKQLNMDIRVFNKLFDMSDKELNSYFKSTLEIRQEAIRTRKMELVDLARDLYGKHYSLRKIAEMLGINSRTGKKYVDPNFTPIHGNYGAKRKRILDSHLDKIHELFEKGNTSETIFQAISKDGYTGSSSNVRNYIAELKKMKICTTSSSGKQGKIETITVKRKDLLKTLYNPTENIKGLSPELITKARNRYPFFAEIVNLVAAFKEILNSKNATRLDQWIVIAKCLNNKYIDSFINGITRDLDAVKNAIIYDYNNGLAEGSINKVKVIKRIMYGRNSFEMLRNKVLWLEQKR